MKLHKYIIYIVFFSKTNIVSDLPDPKPPSLIIENSSSIGKILNSKSSLDSGLAFLKVVDSLYNFNANDKKADTARLTSIYKQIENLAKKYNLEIGQIREMYLSKYEVVKKQITLDTSSVKKIIVKSN